MRLAGILWCERGIEGRDARARERGGGRGGCCRTEREREREREIFHWEQYSITLSGPTVDSACDDIVWHVLKVGR
jgi:hypothetical protein